MAQTNIEVSVTEMPHFRRLTEFVEQVSGYADDHENEDLQALVRTCRIDLLHIMRQNQRIERFDL